MAEPNTQPSSTPPLAAVPDPQAPKPAAKDERKRRGGAPWWLFAILALLLVGTFVGLVGQTQHARAQAQEIVSLTSQVGELETQLSTVAGHLANFSIQRELVGVSVGKLSQQLADLRALVDWDPIEAVGAPPAARSGQSAAPEAKVEEPAAAAAEAASEATASGEAAAGETAGEGASVAPKAAEAAKPPAQPGAFDLDSVPGLKPGPSLELAPRDQV